VATPENTVANQNGRVNRSRSPNRSKRRRNRARLWGTEEVPGILREMCALWTSDKPGARVALDIRGRRDSAGSANWSEINEPNARRCQRQIGGILPLPLSDIRRSIRDSAPRSPRSRTAARRRRAGSGVGRSRRFVRIVARWVPSVPAALPRGERGVDVPDESRRHHAGPTLNFQDGLELRRQPRARPPTRISVDPAAKACWAPAAVKQAH
jgi:hypothetical protein